MTTLRNGWAEYEANVVPDGAPAVQRRDMEGAFYAGASACVAAIAQRCPGGASREEMGQALESIVGELMAHITQRVVEKAKGE